MTSDATSLRVVNLEGCDGSNLSLLHVEEVDVMCSGVEGTEDGE